MTLTRTHSALCGTHKYPRLCLGSYNVWTFFFNQFEYNNLQHSAKHVGYFTEYKNETGCCAKAALWPLQAPLWAQWCLKQNANTQFLLLMLLTDELSCGLLACLFWFPQFSNVKNKLLHFITLYSDSMNAIWHLTPSDRWCRNPVLKGCNPARFSVLPGRKQLSPRHLGRNSSPGRTENTVGLWPVLQGNFVRALMSSLRSLKLFYISLITNCVDIPQQSAQMNCLQYEVLFIRNSRIQFWWNSILDFFF